VLGISNKSYSQNFIIDSKAIWHNIFYDTSVNFLCTYPFLYTAGMCDVTYIGVYNIYLHGKCFLSALYNDIICLAPAQSVLLFCLLTQVHKRMPLLEVVHYAQTNITLPAEIQRAPCLLLQRTRAILPLFSFRRPVL